MENNKTFELMKAYSNLGAKEQVVIEYLFEENNFEGSYSKLARKVNLQISNLRHTLRYLDALGIVKICYDKPMNEIETYKDKNGKTLKKHNPMKSCYLVNSWFDVLIREYKMGNIYCEEIKKKQFVDYTLERSMILWN